MLQLLLMNNICMGSSRMLGKCKLYPGERVSLDEILFILFEVRYFG